MRQQNVYKVIYTMDNDHIACSSYYIAESVEDVKRKLTDRKLLNIEHMFRVNIP